MPDDSRDDRKDDQKPKPNPTGTILPGDEPIPTKAMVLVAIAAFVGAAAGAAVGVGAVG
jgi:hypothetical protein